MQIRNHVFQFAGVHYFTKNGSGEIIHDSDSEEEEYVNDEDANSVRIERVEIFVDRLNCMY